MDRNMENEFLQAIKNRELDDFGATIPVPEGATRYNNKDDEVNANILLRLEQ
jgi:hypothetical protein